MEIEYIPIIGKYEQQRLDYEKNNHYPCTEDPYVCERLQELA